MKQLLKHKLIPPCQDLQNIPFHPLIQPDRNVDVIFAIDSSADTVADSALNWPNGTAMVATYERSLNDTMQNGTAFPAIPDQNTFVNLGLNNRPTFFGCNASNSTGHTPLIVYLPNSPYVYTSNTSTFQMEYNNTERDAMIQNGYDIVTQGNGTRDSEWPSCVGCAILSRSWNRTNTDVPEVCQKCFTKYCWDGKVDSKTPKPYFPEMVLDRLSTTKSGVGRFVPNSFGLALAAIISASFML